MKLKIGIAGTRGVPNQYGGFEQFAACLSKGLVDRGHEVTVYNTHDHPHQNKEWNGVQIIHCLDPAYLGTAGQFVYDLKCILDARKRNFDVLLLLGYTSSSIWGRWYPPKTTVVTNMDGMEWKRSKYSKPVQFFLMQAEKLAMRYSDYIVADSAAIKKYLDEKYATDVRFISYGSEFPTSFDETVLSKYDLEKSNYYLLIARMEPENNIEMILDGLTRRDDSKKVMVVGNIENSFGQRINKKFASNASIIFPGTIYERTELDALRANCSLYFHGHSVGGTNPSLLEAMSCSALICAHDNVFNKAVLGDDAYWFRSVDDIAMLAIDQDRIASMVNANIGKVKHDHSWEKIIGEYENLFMKAYQSRI